MECSDPYGWEIGATPDWLVGRYGYWWGAQWSAGTIRGFDGVGPTDHPFVDALDRVALEHDIECWLAGEAHHNPKLNMKKDDRFRVENVYHTGGQIVAREFQYADDLRPHLNAQRKLKALPPDLKRRLKMTILLYSILQAENKGTGLGGRLMSHRFDSVVKASTLLLGLAQVKVDVAQLMNLLRNPQLENVPLNALECEQIRQRIQKALQGRGDPRVVEVLATLER